MTSLVTRSWTAQPSGSHPQALRVAAHSQQVVSLVVVVVVVGAYSSAEVQSAYSTAPADGANTL